MEKFEVILEDAEGNPTVFEAEAVHRGIAKEQAEKAHPDLTVVDILDLKGTRN